MHLNYKSVTTTSYFIVLLLRLFFASNVPVRIRALCFAAAQSDWSTSLFYFQTSFTPLAFFKRTRLITRKHIKPHFNANFHYHDFFSFVQFRSKGYPQLHLSTLTGASWSPSVPVKCSAGSFWRPTA